MKRKIAVVLSGCGFLDGAEIHESVLTLLHIKKSGADLMCFAPDINQVQVVDHVTRQRAEGTRSVLSESARIARCDVSPLEALQARDFNAVIFPGGFGAVTHLCDFATKGAGCSVHPEAKRVVEDFFAAKKPIGAICIAPGLIASVLGKYGVSLTIGTNSATAETLEKTGAKHVNKSFDEIHVDEKNLIVTTPAYMLANNIAQVDEGVGKLVWQILKMCG